MGKFRSSLVGFLRNHVGQNLYQVSRKQNIVRAMPSHYTDLNSASQQKQRAAFQLVNNFAKQVRSISENGWTPLKPGHTIRNEIIAYNMKHSISWSGVVWNWIYANMKFNKGPLLNQSGFSVYGGGSGMFGISWSSILNPGSNLNDTLFVVTYCPDTSAIDAFATGCNRVATPFSSSLPGDQIGHIVHFWGSFSNPAGTKSSDTFYIGSIMLT